MMMSTSVIYGIFVAIVNIYWSNSQATNMYLSTAEYEELLPKVQEKIITLIKLIEEEWLEYEQDDQLASWKRFLHRYKKEYEIAKLNSSFLQNPVNAFIVFKRLTTDFKMIKELTQQMMGIGNDFANIIINEGDWPDEEDLHGAAIGLRRIQATYKLDVKDLAEGKLNYDGVTHSLPMMASDCYEMSGILYDYGDLTGAKSWIEETIRKGRLEEDENELYQNLLDVIDEESSKNEISEYEVWNIEGWQNQASLCRNEFEVPHNISKRFACYLMRDSPFLLLAPVKTEQLYLDPDILIYYDVISDDEIEHLKQLAKPRMERSESTRNNHARNIADYRTCKLAWFEGNLSKVIKRISQRIIDVTGLKIDKMSAEKLQIINYGIGGHYDAHHDFFMLNPALVYNPDTATELKAGTRTCKYAWLEDSESEISSRISRRITDIAGLSTEESFRLQIVNYGIGGHYDFHYDFYREQFTQGQDNIINLRGNRLATVLFYISEVAQGGATVFTELGLSVFPVKNAALYWRNLHPSGEGNQATKHAACPVLKGSKWTLTKWIRQHGQELLSPCNLEYQQEEVKREYPQSKKIK